MPHDFKNFPELTNNQMRFYYFDSPHKQITENFIAKVIKVTDGDTIRVEWDERDFDFPVRFLGTNAPEITKGKEEVGGKESHRWLENQLLNQEVEILIDPANRVGKWGRILGEILFQGMNINKLSILLGYARKFEDAPFETITEIR